MRNYLNHKNCCSLSGCLTSTYQGRGRFFLAVKSLSTLLMGFLLIRIISTKQLSLTRKIFSLMIFLNCSIETQWTSLLHYKERASIYPACDAVPAAHLSSLLQLCWFTCHWEEVLGPSGSILLSHKLKFTWLNTMDCICY